MILNNMKNNQKMNQNVFEYLKDKDQLLYLFQSMKWEVPQINLKAPQGTSIFQTYYEYKYSNLLIIIIIKVSQMKTEKWSKVNIESLSAS